jgi:hypothetical protein
MKKVEQLKKNQYVKKPLVSLSKIGNSLLVIFAL